MTWRASTGDVVLDSYAWPRPAHIEKMMWRKTSEEQPEHLARVVVRAASGQEALARWAFGGWWIGGHPYDASLWPEWRPR